MFHLKNYNILPLLKKSIKAFVEISKFDFRFAYLESTQKSIWNKLYLERVKKNIYMTAIVFLCLVQTFLAVYFHLKLLMEVSGEDI